MSSDINHRESIRIAHLTMLQSVVLRMGSNSFALNALSATFGSAAVAIMVSSGKPSPYYAFAATVPILIFWLMDAQYLRYERAYRRLYEHVRKGEDVDDYSLEVKPFMADAASMLRLAISWSVGWFYSAIIISLGIVAVLFFKGS